MAATQPDPTQPAGQPPAPDAHLTDRQLDTALNCELAIADQSPRSASGWAAAFGPASPNLGGGGQGGGYSFSPEQFDGVIGQWRTVLQRAQSFDEQIRIITAVTAAADDEASTSFTRQAQALGSGVKASHDTLKAYAAAYIARLQSAQARYQSTEQAVDSSLRAQSAGGRP